MSFIVVYCISVWTPVCSMSVVTVHISLDISVYIYIYIYIYVYTYICIPVCCISRTLARPKARSPLFVGHSNVFNLSLVTCLQHIFHSSVYISSHFCAASLALSPVRERCPPSSSIVSRSIFQVSFHTCLLYLPAPPSLSLFPHPLQSCSRNGDTLILSVMFHFKFLLIIVI